MDVLVQNGISVTTAKYKQIESKMSIEPVTENEIMWTHLCSVAVDTLNENQFDWIV